MTRPKLQRRGLLSVLATLLGATIIATGAAGCGDDTGPTYDADACTDFRIPNRFGYRWERLNHRVSSWGHRLTPSPGFGYREADADTRCRATRLDTTFQGGTFATGEQQSDTPQLKYAYQTVDRDSPRQLGAARRQIAATIPATPGASAEGPDVDGTASGRITWQRDDLELQHYDTVTALIDGFEFFTDLPQSASYPDDYNPAHGYTSRGMSASVSVVETTNETVTVEWRLRFGFGATEDRESLNRAIPHARVGALLGITLVGTSADRVHRGTVDYSLSYPHQSPFIEQVLSHAETDDQIVQLNGSSSYGRGVWGLRHFSFRLAPDVGCNSGQESCPVGDSCGEDNACQRTYGPAGYYMREFSVDVSLDDYDRQTGRARFLVDGFASNSSQAVAFYAMNHDFAADITWIQTGSAPERTSLDTSHPAGATAISLDN